MGRGFAVPSCWPPWRRGQGSEPRPQPAQRSEQERGRFAAQRPLTEQAGAGATLKVLSKPPMKTHRGPGSYTPVFAGAKRAPAGELPHRQRRSAGLEPARQGTERWALGACSGEKPSGRGGGLRPGASRPLDERAELPSAALERRQPRKAPGGLERAGHRPAVTATRRGPSATARARNGRPGPAQREAQPPTPGLAEASRPTRSCQRAALAKSRVPILQLCYTENQRNRQPPTSACNPRQANALSSHLLKEKAHGPPFHESETT
jgi:hypothetical protein